METVPWTALRAVRQAAPASVPQDPDPPRLRPPLCAGVRPAGGVCVGRSSMSGAVFPAGTRLWGPRSALDLELMKSQGHESGTLGMTWDLGLLVRLSKILLVLVDTRGAEESEGDPAGRIPRAPPLALPRSDMEQLCTPHGSSEGRGWGWGPHQRAPSLDNRALRSHGQRRPAPWNDLNDQDFFS